MRKWNRMALLSVGLAVLLAVPAMANSFYAGSEEEIGLASDGGDQMLFGDVVWSGDGAGVFDAAKKGSEPNTKAPLPVPEIPAGAVRRLTVESHLCGVAVERSQTGEFELFLAGVKEADRRKIRTALSLGEDGTLTLTASGSVSLGYLNTDPGFRVNTVVLRVPGRRLDALEAKVGAGVARLSDLADEVRGTADRGTLFVADDTVLGGYTLASKSGSVRVEGNTVSGKLDASTQNGSASVEGGVVSGPVKLASKNGSVKLSAETLAGATLETVNGSVCLDAGTLTGDVSAKCTNGNVQANLRAQPRDLRLSVSHNSNGHVALPAGWQEDLVVGRGAPVLTLATKNGGIGLTIGARRTN